MNCIGIQNITEKELNYSYDKHYRETALSLKKAKTENEKNEIKNASKQTLQKLLKNISININYISSNFINLLLSKNSAQYLWILYSKYDNEENYLDEISSILKQQNTVIRGGTNTYKVNGWMAHTLYVYQITNYNIPENIGLLNFNQSEENINQVNILNQIYKTLTNESKFILKIFALIHDIGVIEDINQHANTGIKYVKQVLEEIGLTQNILDKNNINLSLSDLITTLKILIKDHILITLLSAESNDKYVENKYKSLLHLLPELGNSKNDIPKILFLLAYADVIGVDESLMNSEKFNRINDCYNFFKQITEGISVKRNKEKVAIERICDMTGESSIQNLSTIFDSILEKQDINKAQFVEDMYNIKLMRFTGVLLKNLKDINFSIKIYYELFELLGELSGKNELTNYTITFLPDKHESLFIEQFKNGNFFKCINKMKKEKQNNCTYENINIINGTDSDGKFLNIRII
jgi:hypothetical protein